MKQNNILVVNLIKQRFKVAGRRQCDIMSLLRLRAIFYNKVMCRLYVRTYCLRSKEI